LDEVTAMEPGTVTGRRAEAAGVEEVRAQVHGMWASVAPSWDEHAEDVDARAAPLTERLLEAAALGPGDRVLELACGPGGTGLAAARRVLPGGEVVLSDVAPPMTAIAARRARALGLGNVTTRVLDLERIDEPDAAYAAVLCREGLMFAVDPAAGAREIHRVLRPGGRVAIAVWGPRERNPWLGVLLDAVSAQVGRPLPPPGVPGPFALADAGRLGALLAGAGLEAVGVSEVPVPLRAPSPEAWWARGITLAGPVRGLLERMSDAERGAVRARATGEIAAHATEDGLEIPGVALLATARRRSPG
jgi:ubiquinone/menaquinone biosynthesis C-methylase UbiE